MDPSFHPLPATPMFIFETHAALAIVYSELPVQSMRVAANVLDRDVRMTCILERTVNFKDRRRNKNILATVVPITSLVVVSWKASLVAKTDRAMRPSGSDHERETETFVTRQDTCWWRQLSCMT